VAQGITIDDVAGLSWKLVDERQKVARLVGSLSEQGVLTSQSS